MVTERKYINPTCNLHRRGRHWGRRRKKPSKKFPCYKRWCAQNILRAADWADSDPPDSSYLQSDMPAKLKLFEICAFPAVKTWDTFVGCQITSSLLRSLAVSGGFWGVWGLSGVENMLLWTSALMHHVTAEAILYWNSIVPVQDQLVWLSGWCL